MIFGYIRVSTESQTVENQRYEIENKGNFHVDVWYEETKSGTIDYHNRILNKCLKRMKSGDTLVCSELSRLGRSLYMVMEILNLCLNKGITVITIKDNFRLDNSISSKVISFAFGLSAEIERNLISQRTKEALAMRKAQGMILGRPVGSKNKIYKLDKYKDKIFKYKSEGKSVYYIAKKLKQQYGSVKNYLIYNNLF